MFTRCRFTHRCRRVTRCRESRLSAPSEVSSSVCRSFGGVQLKRERREEEEKRHFSIRRGLTNNFNYTHAKTSAVSPSRKNICIEQKKPNKQANFSLCIGGALQLQNHGAGLGLLKGLGLCFRCKSTIQRFICFFIDMWCPAPFFHFWYNISRAL